MNIFKYSVLMSVYYKEQPDYLRESIMSMLDQSIKPDEIVLIKDGKLTDELENVLNEFKDNQLIKIYSLEHNVGLGNALNFGVQKCKNELIARMDTDDISMKNRCELQLQLFTENKELSVIGSAVEEFINHPDNVMAFKEVKVENSEIRKQMKYRNPIIHPSVMFKKSDVLKAGNYEHWFLNEDYYLWIRMIQKGFVFKNINEPLVKMRINNETYLRRGGWDYFITQKRLFKYMLKNNLINSIDYIYNNSIRFVVRLMIPNSLRKLLYLRVMRKKVN
ncbi:putative glycosyltransferase [Bacillus sp. ZZV12-4809]|nr:putative glycosyltransferase [Bacillus sp. ZZV12-4809]